MKRFQLLRACVAIPAVLLIVAVRADDDERGQMQFVRKIAGELRGGNQKSAEKLAAFAAKRSREVEHLMELLERRERRGFGLRVPGFARKSLSMEKAIQLFAKKKLAAADLQNNANALMEMGYSISAVAKICKFMPPRRERGKKTKARWITYSESMDEGALEFVKAVKARSVAGVQQAAISINGNCNSCHKIFRK